MGMIREDIPRMLARLKIKPEELEYQAVLTWMESIPMEG